MAYIGVSPSNGVRRVHTYTATASQTTFSGAGAEGTSLSYKDSNFVDVYQNGIKLGDADYTSTSGTSIVLAQGASVDDLVVVVVFDVFSVADTVSKADGGTFDNAVTITTADNSVNLNLVSTDADANSGPELELYRNSASPADNDFVGTISFQAENDAGEKIEYGVLKTRIVDASDGTEDFRMTFEGKVGGSDVQLLKMDNSNIVFNEDSKDIDFRVESNDSVNMFVVNAGTNRIGIGTDSPSHPLHIETSSDGTGVSGADLFAAFIKNPESTSGQSYGLKIQAASTTDQILNLTTLDAAYARFYVQGNGFTRVSANNASGYAFKVAHDGDNSNRYGIAIQTGSDTGSGTNYLLGFQDGDGNSIGSITFSGGTVSYNPFTASHPCIVPNSDNDKNSTANAYPYGTLLEVISISYTQKDGADSERGILYNVQKSSSAKSKAVIGAYSSSMNGSSLDENTVETNKHLVHVLGDGHILCNNENGNIAVGDYICTSSTSGEGMKATSICATIGIARETITFKDSKAVLVAVEYGYRQFIPEDIEARITALESK